MKKRCGRCGKSKNPKKDFSKKREGRQPLCKLCQSDYQKTYYRKHRAAQIVRCNKRRDEQVRSNQENVIAYLRKHPCVDCGETDIIVLQFDHVRGKKFLEIGRMMMYPWRRIQEEIAKCEVRCANDHTRRTAVQQKNYKVSWVTGVSGNIPPS